MGRLISVQPFTSIRIEGESISDSTRKLAQEAKKRIYGLPVLILCSEAGVPAARIFAVTFETQFERRKELGKDPQDPQNLDAAWGVVKEKLCGEHTNLFLFDPIMNEPIWKSTTSKSLDYVEIARNLGVL